MNLPALDATQDIEKSSRGEGSNPSTGANPSGGPALQRSPEHGGSTPSPGAISPFLPGTKIQYAWDSTSLGWFKTCPRLYQYHMIEGWRGKGGSVHLEFGSLYHSALELYDRLMATGENHEEALHQTVLKALDETWDRGLGQPKSWDHNLKTRETLVRSIIWYLDEFKDHPAKTVILANGQPAVELSFRFELDWGPKYYDLHPYILCGHIDRLVTFHDEFYVTDRKTTSSTPGAYYFDGYSPDNQMSLYTLAAKIIYKTPVKGVFIDAAQIAVGFTRFSSGFTHRTDSQLEEWLVDLRSWLKLAEGYATDNYWPMNDKSCHQYGGCTFRKICSKSPAVREKFLESDFDRRPWNPLEVR